MLTEAELLQYIYQTTEMGRDGIQSVLPHAEDDQKFTNLLLCIG